MPEKLTVHRKWKNAGIKVSLDSDGVRAETSTSDFTNRLSELMLEQYPEVIPDKYKDLAWSFRRETLEKIVKEILDETLTKAVDKAIKQVIREMKEQVVQIV